MSIEKNTPSTLIHEQLPFTTLFNETINKITDPASLGIYCYLASKPSNWEISTKNLMNHFSKGRDFINEKLKYLRDIGALIIQDIRDSKGRFIRRETLLKRKIDQSTTLKTQDVDNPGCGESVPTNKRNIKNTDSNKSIVDSEKSTSYKEDGLFMTFYSIYPNKQKPEIARKAFYKHKPTPEFVSMLCTDVNKRVENNWKNRHKNKIPHPATYLNSREWEGEIYAPESNVANFPVKPARYKMNELLEGLSDGGIL